MSGRRQLLCHCIKVNIVKISAIIIVICLSGIVHERVIMERLMKVTCERYKKTKLVYSKNLPLSQGKNKNVL